MKSENKLLELYQKSQWFRVGAGAIITNEKGEVLAFERRDVPGAWQMPQGGLDAGEEPDDGVYREIEEETGIKKEYLSLITNEFRLLPYELPEEYRSNKTGRGQVQYWYLFQLNGTEDVIGLGDKKEFSNWRWMSMEELVSKTVSFRKPVYEELVEFVAKHFPSS